jgi:hypothetical protein
MKATNYGDTYDELASLVERANILENSRHEISHLCNSLYINVLLTTKDVITSQLHVTKRFKFLIIAFCAHFYSNRSQMESTLLLGQTVNTLIMSFA